MTLWTDIIDPATLTGYARASLVDYEASRSGSLATYLPNRMVEDIVVRFVAGESGLVDVADFRAYDAEPTVGKRPTEKRVTLELPALGKNLPVSEYEQLRARGNGTLPPEAALATIQRTTDLAVRTVADALERLRGVVLKTGKATITGGGFSMDDDFGRKAGHSVTASTLWSTSTADALGMLEDWSDVYRASTGVEPGSMLISTKVLRALAGLDQFAVQLNNGASRRASRADIQAIVDGAGLPPVVVYDRLVTVGGTATKVLDEDSVFLLPPPVDVNDWMGTELGATFWGRPLTATDPEWGLETGDQAGVVAGVWKHDKPPMGLEIISDAIGMPVLANANLSFVAEVL